MIVGFEAYKEKWQVASDTAIKPGLEAMQVALRKLGSPQQGMRFIHVAGTNGKGSVIAFLESMLLAHGVKVGKFMSPCIVDVHDQLQVNGQNIHPEQMDALFERMQQAGLSGQCTDFELLTCAALLHFHLQQVDIVLLETGMGGLLDSTNVQTPLVSVITSIALEHTNFLGNTLEEIAQHKAGIIKQQVPVVVGELPPAAEQVVVARAEQMDAPLWQVGHDFFVTDTTFANDVLQLDDLTRKMRGAHQAQNMALAVQAFSLAAKEMQLQVDQQQLKVGVEQAVLGGRFEEVLPQVYFDGAHNPASIEKLVATIQQEFPHKNVEIVIGMLADKDVEQALRLLETVSTTFIFVNFDNERAMKAIQLLQKSEAPDRRITHDIIGYLKSPVDTHTIKIVTGSLYLLAALREKLLKA